VYSWPRTTSSHLPHYLLLRPIELILTPRPKLTPVCFRQPLCVHYITQPFAQTLGHSIPLSRYIFLSNTLSQDHFASMTDQSVSSRLPALFELALEDYEVKTKISLAEHSFAQKLEDCHSVESITTLLQDQARAFGEFRGRARIMESIRSTVSSLDKLSATAAFGGCTGSVRQKAPMTALHLSDIVLQAFPPAKAVHTGLGVLLAVCFS